MISERPYVGSTLVFDERRLYKFRVGDYRLVYEVDELSPDEITTIFETIAKSEGVTREMLLEEVEKAREELMAERVVSS